MDSLIHTYRWKPPTGVAQRSNGFYILHGTGEHAARYEQLATRLSAAGWQVGAHDHPGHGQSAGKRGLIDPSESLSEQAIIQIEAFANEVGSMPVLFGHSLGGVVASDLVLQHGLQVKGLILSAPAFVPITTPIDRFKLKLLTLVAPKLCLDLGYNASKLTHDENMAKSATTDPLMHSFKSAVLVNWIIKTGQQSIDSASNLKTRTLLLIAGDDLVIDSEQIRLFASRVDAEKLSSVEYDDFFHELLHETPERRERVLADIESWLFQID